MRSKAGSGPRHHVVSNANASVIGSCENRHSKVAARPAWAYIPWGCAAGLFPMCAWLVPAAQHRGTVRQGPTQ